MKTLLCFAIALMLTACKDNVPEHEHETQPSTAAIDVAVKNELKWAQLSARQMTWRQAYAYCEGLPHAAGAWWRMASVLELYALHGFVEQSIGAGPGPDVMWSALIHPGGNHHTVNIRNGARSWRGDERQAYVMCVKGYSARVDAMSWVMELYNARLVGNGARVFAIVQRMASAGLPEGQLELGNAYLKGEGVAPDVARAREWYKKAADQGEQHALDNLRRLADGTMYQLPEAANRAAAGTATSAPAGDTAGTPEQAQQQGAAISAASAPARPPAGTLLVLALGGAAQAGRGPTVSLFLSPRTTDGEQIVEQSTARLKTLSLELLRAQTAENLRSKAALGALSGRLLDLLNHELGGPVLAEVSLEPGEPDTD